jgi:lycopene cyclase domain-containing protein
MEEYEYLILLVGCFGLAAVAAWIYGVWKNVWRQRQRLVLAIGITFIFFSAWDYFAILRKHWWFSEKYIIGLRVFGIPLEELAFFVIVPLSCLLTWEILIRVLKHNR